MSISNSYKDRRARERAATNSDEVEIQSFRNSDAAVDSGIEDELIASALDDFEYDGLDITAWEGRQSALDDASGETLEELIFREQVLENNYPFVLTAGNTNLQKIFSEPRSSAELVYLFCLIVSTAPNITTGLNKWLPRIFELLSAELTKVHLGNNSSFFHTGWPRSKNKPTKFKDLMNELHTHTSEWVWSPEDDLPNDPSTHDVKDEGMDFVAWKISPDNQSPGHITFLGQCACGNDWSTKLDDINLEKLKKWFNPMTRIHPLKVFTTPFFLPEVSIKETTREAGLVLDRRLLTLIAHQNNWQPEAFLEEAMEGLIDFFK